MDKHVAEEIKRQQQEAIQKGMTGSRVNDPVAVKDFLDRGRKASNSGGSSTSSSGSGCFVGHTRILVPGGTRAIAELWAGDAVMAIVDGRGATLAARDILAVRRYRGGRVWHLTTAERVIATTKNHTFLTTAGWRRARSIGPGDRLVIQDDRCVREEQVTASAATGERVDVYNLVVDDAFTFCAEGVPARSFTFFRRVREALWRMRAVGRARRKAAVDVPNWRHGWAPR